MKIEIFDVEHGGCALITADNNRRILIDCGHNSTTGWRPSRAFSNRGINQINLLVVSNYDEDHVSDLSNLRQSISIDALYRNKSVSSEILRKMKHENGMGYGIESLVDMMGTYTQNLTSPLDFGGIQRSHFYNTYPEFDDENNLSVVTILRYRGFGIIFPGDMEKAGWLKLLQRSDFCAALSDVNVFVASHHGRESGYCEEIFDYCHPEIIVFSDCGVRYDTQKTANWYSQYAKGIQFNGGNRYVLTTRNDGMISFDKIGNDMCHVSLQNG